MSRHNKSQFAKMAEAFKQEKNGGKKTFAGEENFWTLERDDAGNGAAIIRFLPAADEDSLPFVKYYSYSFKSKIGRWFIENSPSSIGKPCPVMDFNGHLWNEIGTEEAKNQARNQKRTLNYVFNILVVSDPKHPENNGKVFKFRTGKKIFDKITEKIAPENPEMDDPIDVFDLFEGANFKLKCKTVANAPGQKGFPNYDSSEFAAQSSIVKSEEEEETLLSQLHDIQYLVDEKNFKSYDEIKKRLDYVLGDAAKAAPKVEPEEEEEESTYVKPETRKIDIDDDIPEEVRKPTKPAKPVTVIADDDDDDLEFFRNLSK